MNLQFLEFLICLFINTKYNFCVELAQLVCYLFIIHICPNLRSNFCIHRPLQHFQRILCISKRFGLRGEGLEILTMISVQKCHFLANLENWTNVCVCCSCKLIINDECLVYIQSWDFFLNTHITKLVQFHVSLIWSTTGPISSFMVLPLWFRLAR